MCIYVYIGMLIYTQRKILENYLISLQQYFRPEMLYILIFYANTEHLSSNKIYVLPKLLPYTYFLHFSGEEITKYQ